MYKYLLLIERHRGGTWLERVSSPNAVDFEDLCRMVQLRMINDTGQWDWDRDGVTLLDEPEEIDYTDFVWEPSDVSKTIPMRSNDLVFEDANGESHHFVVLATKDRVVFGDVTNTGFLESGYLKRTAGESLEALLEELQSYYEDGPESCTRIVYNERM